MTKLLHYKCLRCGYEWIPRTDTPKKCPGCKSSYYNRPRRKDLTIQPTTGKIQSKL